MGTKKKRDMSTDKQPSRQSGGNWTAPMVQAVMFLGADSLSMMVAETRGGEHRVLDILSQPLELAQDVFNKGELTRYTMDRCVQIARGYDELLAEYRLAGEVRVRLLGTNILLNIRNMDTLVNRMQIACRLQLEIMDDGEMTRLLYLNVKSLLNQHPELEKKRALVLHVGPGNTRVLVLEKGRIAHYGNYRLGAHRTGITIAHAETDLSGGESVLVREHIRGTIEQMRYDVEGALPHAPDALIIFGPDFRRVVEGGTGKTAVTTARLSKLAEQIAATPMEQRPARFHEDYASVCYLLPCIHIFLTAAREFKPRTIICPAEEYDHAFLSSVLPTANRDDSALEDEVVHFSTLLANRYRADLAHSDHIVQLSMSLFDQLQALHGLARHDRLLLRVAAILHEIGGYVSPKNHHRHSQYIILNSEIFGLSRQDVEIVGLLARYHRHGPPSAADSSYTELDLSNRLRVQKLAALLRVAEAMERAHARRISSFTVRFNNKRLELLVPDVQDLTLENMGLRSKGAMFADIFGYEAILLPGR